MGLFQRLESRQANRLQETITETSRCVATELVDFILEENTFPYRISVGEKPKRIESEEYLERINYRVERCLARVGLEHLVHYDQETSRRANTVHIEPETGGGFDYEAKNLSIVYDKS